MKRVVHVGLFALLVIAVVDGVFGHQTSQNCTAEYMDNLLQQALQVKEQCDILTGRYDCCKAMTLSKLVLLHTPQTGVYETTNPCSLSSKNSKLLLTRCDFETDGGGWTVILRRRRDEPHTDFNRVWEDYETGFGDPNHEYWIGLKNIHCLTLRDNVELMIDLRNADGNGMTWIYNYFKVASSDDHYRISIGNGIGPSDGFDAMTGINGSQFTTRDSDHDSSSLNCAQRSAYGGGWWHSNCYYAQLTGPHVNGIYWYKGSGPIATTSASYYNYYQHAEMKIRSQTCKNECH